MMTQPRRGLGRGLEALFGGSTPASAPGEPGPAERPAPEASHSGPATIDIDLIAPNPEQPRTNFEPEKLRELADSIREHGIIQLSQQ